MKIQGKSLVIAAIAATLIGAPRAGAQMPGKPTYDGPATQALVEAMLEAHGWERWQQSSAARFELVMYLPELTRMLPGRPYANAWRRYDTTLEPRTSRAYIDIPFEADQGPAAGFDGASLWGRGYTPDPNISDPPPQLLYMHSSFVRMPFLTQLPGAELSDGGMDSLPGRTESLRVVEMKFESETQGPILFRLFVDPQTNLLVGFEHNAFYPPLPGGIPPLAFPRMPAPTTIARIVEQRQEVDGVILPRAYISVAENEAGEVRLTGTHLVQAAELDAAFDTAKAAPSAGARIIMKVR
ncbi:MAG: hypothetical protein ABFS14_13010 [Gemmatimonadota bacterium]